MPITYGMNSELFNSVLNVAINRITNPDPSTGFKYGFVSKNILVFAKYNEVYEV
jgi:hypothetical protein